VNGASSCFRDQCSLQDRQLLQSVWNTNCNITVTAVPFREELDVTSGSKVGIVFVSIAIAALVIIPTFTLLRRQRKVDHSQKNGTLSYIVLLLTSPWLNWLASHIGFTSTAIALVFICSIATNADETLYPGGPCGLDNLEWPCIIVSWTRSPYIFSLPVLIIHGLIVYIDFGPSISFSSYFCNIFC
jgi:hypothetical protein